MLNVFCFACFVFRHYFKMVLFVIIFFWANYFHSSILRNNKGFDFSKS